MSHEWKPDAFNKELQGDNHKRLLDSILLVENAAKRRCPKVTGRLAGSMTHAVGFNLASVMAGGKTYDGSNVDYAIYVELGTIHFPGRFYLRGAMRSSMPAIKKIWGIT